MALVEASEEKKKVKGDAEVVYHYPGLVTLVVPRIRQKHTATPETEDVEARRRRRLHQHAVRLRVQPAFQLLHRDHVGAARKKRRPVDPKEHAQVLGALLALRRGDVRWARIVARDERHEAKADRALRHCLQT